MCQQSQKAKYTQRVDYIVQLPVPMDQATNTGEGLTGNNETPILHTVSSSHSAHCGEQDNGKAVVTFRFMSSTVSPGEKAQNQTPRENKGLGA